MMQAPMRALRPWASTSLRGQHRCCLEANSARFCSINLFQSDWIQLNPHEAIIGDSHQYAPLHGLAAGQVDEVIDEGVTNEVLRVAGTMLTGLNELRQSRMGDDGRTAQGASAVPAARLLSQWHGTYMQHSDGILNATIAAQSESRTIRFIASGISDAHQWSAAVHSPHPSRGAICSQVAGRRGIPWLSPSGDWHWWQGHDDEPGDRRGEHRDAVSAMIDFRKACS